LSETTTAPAENDDKTPTILNSKQGKSKPFRHYDHKPTQGNFTQQQQNNNNDGHEIVVVNQELYQLLSITQKKYVVVSNDSSSPTQGSFYLRLSVLKLFVPAMMAWARRKTTHAAEQCETLLRRYVQQALAGNPHAVPNTIMFNIVMDAWAKTETSDAPKRILKLLEWMQTLRRNGKEGIVPSPSQASASSSSSASSTPASQQTTTTNSQSSTQLEIWTQALRPDVFSFSTLVTAWAKSRHPDASSKALSILDYMERKGLQPNTFTYNAVLHALVFSRDKDRADKAERLVLRMERLYEQQLEELLQKGIDVNDHTNNNTIVVGVEPDLYTYQSLMAIWSRIRKAGAPQRVEQILHMLQERSQYDPTLEPNTHCFTAAIHAWARSVKEKSKASHAYKLLCELRDRYEQQQPSNDRIKPNIVSFTAVINACVCTTTHYWTTDDDDTGVDNTASDERDMALKIAHLTMEELRRSPQYGQPNFLTYAAMLRVYGTNLPPGPTRDALVRRTMVQCCQAGQLGQVVWDAFESAASWELVEQTRAALGLSSSSRENAVQDDNDDNLRLARYSSRNVKGERYHGKISIYNPIR
jgi:hypothetical protein